MLAMERTRVSVLRSKRRLPHDEDEADLAADEVEVAVAILEPPGLRTLRPGRKHERRRPDDTARRVEERQSLRMRLEPRVVDDDLAAGPEDMPEKAKDYVEAYVAPYAEGIACWLENLRIGKKGGELWQIIQEKLPFDQFGVYLNPGHLIHFDEWTSSPIFEGSEIRLQSGMYIQSDIIPRSTVYNSSRMEEGYVLADKELRNQIEQMYPAVYARCMARCEWMESLGWTLPEEVLPLSDMAGIIIPFFLDYQNVMTFK